MKLKSYLAFIPLAFLSGGAMAIPVDVSFTGDNIVGSGGLCADSSCAGGTGWGAFGPTPNTGNWTRSDSVTVNLGTGTHWFAWYVTNSGSGSAGNPAGLLAEIQWAGNSNASSASWEYSTNRASWSAATSYGANGTALPWTSVNGGNPVAGISTNAEWIWSASNGNVEMHRALWFRTSITIASVPEPGTLALFGLGLLGMGVAARRRKRAA